MEALANGAIAFLPAPFALKAALGLLLVALPLFFLFQRAGISQSQAGKVWAMDFLSPFSPKAWGLLLLLALGTRLAGLTRLSHWPTMDEEWTGYFSYQLFKKWDWNLLFSDKQIQPAYFWGQALFFHLFGPSLLSLWLFPAAASLLTLALGAWAARKYFSPSFSGFCLLLAILNYWWIWAGRLSEPLTVILPFECLALGVLGLFLKAASHGRWEPWPLLLGVATGLCLYTATVSAFLFAFLCATVAWVAWKKPKGRRRILLEFGSGLCVVLPLIFSALRQGYGRYPQSLWFWKDSGYYENHWMAPLSHLSGIFWGARDWTFWGGFFNPLETSLVFLGLVFCLKQRSKPLNQWLLAAGAFFALPGLLTNNYEPFREILLAPLLLVLMALGWGWLLLEFPAQKSLRRAATAALLVACAALNLYHLWGPYHEAWGRPGPACSRFKNIALWRAYDLLDDWQKAQGPGYVFQDFAPDSSLRLEAYPFNAGDNPRWAGGPVKWFAVLARAQFTPYLSRRFPGSRWTWLSEHLPAGTDGGLELGILPAAPGAPIPAWQKAGATLEEVSRILHQAGGPDLNGQALSLLNAHEADFKGDPFLESVYWDKVQALEAAKGDLLAALDALQTAVRRGYPIPYFYQWKAYYLGAENKTAQAEEALRQARRAVQRETP